MSIGNVRGRYTKTKASIFLLSLVAFLASPSTVRAHYGAGMNLYEYALSSPNNAVDPTGTIQWNTAKEDKGDDVEEQSMWGRIYKVKTDAGTVIDAWMPIKQKDFWCHGYTFGGSTIKNGMSIYGTDVPKVLKDDGWTHIPCAFCKPKEDIAVFEQPKGITHSGIISKLDTLAKGNGRRQFDELASQLTGKPGLRNPVITASFAWHAGKFGNYACYTKQVAARAKAAENPGCMDAGEHENPAPSNWNSQK